MRVSTSQIWGNAVNNLQSAQDRQMQANNQVSTQKVSTDLMGYGRSAEIIASYQATLSNTNAFIDVNKTVSDRLDAQNIALERTSDAASQAKDAIMSALASGDGTSLATALQGAFSSSLDGLNYVHNGQYLFGGGNDDQAPVKVGTLTDLAALTQPSDAFQNGDVKKSSRIDVHTTLQTGMLASDLGTTLMGLFQQYQQQATATPFGSQLDDTQKAFLTNLANQFSTTYDGLVEQTSLNGTMQKRVDNTQTSLQGQVTSLTGLIGDRTDADMAKAYSDLQIAQVSVQASAQVLSSLKDTSLLNLLK
ncbi:flagellin [Asticcacaulis solisilvae]|uniref:flagellin n=1 Tax=Asticcacaulis solisilvae TaxID=1217274 RepID=UPI003FD7A213